jgi:Xaa-Pro aminopeptidase
MVLAIEPGIYIPGLGGMRIEQNYILWADGAEPLSRLSFELLACG